MLWPAAVQKAIRKSSLCFTALTRDLVYKQKKYAESGNVAACASLLKCQVELMLRLCLLEQPLVLRFPDHSLLI